MKYEFKVYADTLTEALEKAHAEAKAYFDPFEYDLTNIVAEGDDYTTAGDILSIKVYVTAESK